MNVGKDELEMDRDLLNTIKKQNKIENDKESLHMRLLKRLKSINKEGMNHSGRILKEEDSIIMEQTHD